MKFIQQRWQEVLIKRILQQNINVCKYNTIILLFKNDKKYLTEEILKHKNKIIIIMLRDLPLKYDQRISLSSSLYCDVDTDQAAVRVASQY